MNVSLGCGEVRHDGYVHVDIRDDCGADVVADASALPFTDGSVAHLRATDLLEHFPRQRIDAVLAEWHRVLAPAGTLTLRVPNLHVLAVHMTYWHDKDTPHFEGFVENLFGGHRYGPDGCWDRHEWGWSPRTLQTDLDRAGFDTLSNDEAVNMTVEAVRR